MLSKALDEHKMRLEKGLAGNEGKLALNDVEMERGDSEAKIFLGESAESLVTGWNRDPIFFFSGCPLIGMNSFGRI